MKNKKNTAGKPKEKLCICYHGTSKENAEKIMKEGFDPRTYFARHLEDALGFGGRFVFGAVFKEELIESSWQFVIPKKKPAKDIVFLEEHRGTRLVFNNEKLREKIFKSNI